MSTPPVPTLTELKLTPQMKEIVDGALLRRVPISLAYVDDDGIPNLSFRGTVQVHGETQLALWARDPGSGLLKAVTRHPAVVALLGDFEPSRKAILTFRGRARIDASEAVRRVVYDTSPEAERNRDPERRGAALIVDLDSVHGLIPGYRVAMRR